MKILLGFGAVLTLMAILSVSVIINIININYQLEETREDVQELTSEFELSYNISQRIALTRGYILFGEQDYKQSFAAYTERSQEIEKELIERYDSGEIYDLIQRSAEWG